MRLVFEIISLLASYASFVGLAISLRDPSTPLSVRDGVIIGVAAVFGVMFLSLYIFDHWNRGVVSLKGADKIKRYMYDWISRGQSVVIFSRDMSWADDEKMKQLLRIKAERNELEPCLPQKTTLSDELQSRGAHVYTYEELKYVPTSRFTIINPGRHDAQVAIGRTVGNRHYVREISKGEDSMFAVADDLVAVVRKSATLRKNHAK